MKSMNKDTDIVRKPWGYEYIAYQNKDVALKILHIAGGESTSMHCHPNKSTGLVVVGGEGEINFIADKQLLTAPAKKMIRRGLFHQTKAISKDGVVMLEIETPVDKDDLVRLRDSYGRQNDGYEDSQFELPRSEDCIWIDDTTNNSFTVGTSTVTVNVVNSLDDLSSKNDDDILIFLKGGLTKVINGRSHLVVQPGDVGQVSVVREVAKEMDGFESGTVLMTVK